MDKGSITSGWILGNGYEIIAIFEARSPVLEGEGRKAKDDYFDVEYFDVPQISFLQWQKMCIFSLMQLEIYRDMLFLACFCKKKPPVCGPGHTKNGFQRHHDTLFRL